MHGFPSKSESDLLLWTDLGSCSAGWTCSVYQLAAQLSLTVMHARLTRGVDGEAHQRLLPSVDKVVLAALGDDDQVTGVDHLLLARDDGLALTLGEDQVLVDVVDLRGGATVVD